MGEPALRAARGTTPRETVAQRLWRALRRSGVRAIYGDAGRGLPVTARAPAGLAPTLVAAHERVHRERAASWVDGVLTIGTPAPGRAGGRPPAAPGARVPTDGDPAAGWLVLLDEAERVAELVGIAAEAAAAGRGLALRVELDLGRPVGAASMPDPAEAAVAPDGSDGVLARLEAAERPVVLAGPGVVTAGAVAGLHAFATAGQVGVLNTWGAKGIFGWSSAHHWATIGLQRDDFRLAGLADADLIVAVGVDRDEAAAARWQLAPHVVVAPGTLGALAERWRRPAGMAPMPPLRHRLAEATQRGWALDTAPLPPSRVTRNYGEIAARGGLVAADPGTAGYWVARTVGTTVLDSVVVPATRVAPGFAIAAALVARLASPARPVLAVLDAPPGVGDGRGDAGSQVAALTELAGSLGVPVPVEVWTPDGPAPDADGHARRLRHAVHGESGAGLPLRTDDRWLARMTDVAGPVIAWPQGRNDRSTQP
ncbi:hypothetical protein [Cryptosporangium arvum]|uniref:hypothetical protein n=1 Tax=Cryptosporangium arvum TaxID=80871 RepID=UPI0004AD4424|nr:hypothetical protein [Cryptosporangium arvum]